MSLELHGLEHHNYISPVFCLYENGCHGSRPKFRWVCCHKQRCKNAKIVVGKVKDICELVRCLACKKLNFRLEGCTKRQADLGERRTPDQN